jgi:DNA-binding transcriptional regulator YiaG
MPIDEKWLREMYLTRRMSIREIARMTDMSVSTVKTWLERCHITRRAPATSPRPSQETLLYLRDKEKLNAKQIATRCQVTERAVHKWFEFYGLDAPRAARMQRAAQRKQGGSQTGARHALRSSQTMPVTEIVISDDETLTYAGIKVRITRVPQGWRVIVLERALGPFETRPEALMEAATVLWDRGYRDAAEALIERANREQRKAR